MIPSGDMKARVLASIQGSPSPTRASQQRLAVLIGLVVSALLAIEFERAGGIVLGNRPIPFVIGTSLAWVVAAVALVVGLRSRGQLGAPSSVLWLLSALSLVIPFGAGLVGNLIYPATAVAVPSHPGYVCVDLSLALSSLPLVAWVFVRRESDPVHPMATGAALGALASCIASLLVNLHCRYSDPAHIAFGHLLPAAVQVGAGVLMGKLMIALREGHSLPLTATALGAGLAGWLAMLANYRTCPANGDPMQWLWLGAALVGGAVVGRVIGLAWQGRSRRGSTSA